MYALQMLIELQTQINEQPEDLAECYSDLLSSTLRQISFYRKEGISPCEFLIDIYNYCFMQEGGPAYSTLPGYEDEGHPDYLIPCFGPADSSGICIRYCKASEI